jgi:voltage-gated potassium channel
MLKRVRRHHRQIMDFVGALSGAFVKPLSLVLISLSATLLVLGSLGFYVLEKNDNPRLTGLLDAFYFCASTITSVGYGDIAPVTAAGKVLAIVLMFLGTALYVCFTGSVAAALLEFESPND